MSTVMHLSERIGRQIKLQDLHVFMTVVQAGSMGKAAERLSTSQPNISRSITGLEHALGVRLLDRHRQGIEATDYGRALFDCGVATFNELRQGLKNIEFLADPSAGELRIGSRTSAASFVSAVVDRLSRRYPRMVFHIVSAEDTLHRELNERSVDLLVARRGRSFPNEQFDFEFLYDDPLVVVAGAQSPWARRRRIDLAELMHEPWVLPPLESVAGAAMMEVFRARGLDYPRAAVVALPREVRIRLLATGRFLTTFAASILRFSSDHPPIKVLPVELPNTGMPTGIVTVKNRTLSPVARLFIENAHHVAKQLSKTKE